MSKYAERYQDAMWDDSEQHLTAAEAAYARGDRATGQAEAAHSLDALQVALRLGQHNYSGGGTHNTAREEWEGEAGL